MYIVQKLPSCAAAYSLQDHVPFAAAVQRGSNNRPMVSFIIDLADGRPRLTTMTTTDILRCAVESQTTLMANAK